MNNNSYYYEFNNNDIICIRGIIQNFDWIEQGLQWIRLYMMNRKSQYTNKLMHFFVKNIEEYEMERWCYQIKEEINKINEECDNRKNKIIRLKNTNEKSMDELNDYIRDQMEEKIIKEATGIENKSLEDIQQGLTLMRQKSLFEFTDCIDMLKSLLDQKKNMLNETTPDFYILELSYGMEKAISGRTPSGKLVNEIIQTFIDDNETKKNNDKEITFFQYIKNTILYNKKGNIQELNEKELIYLIQIHEFFNNAKEMKWNVLNTKKISTIQKKRLLKYVENGLLSLSRFPDQDENDITIYEEIYISIIQEIIIVLNQFYNEILRKKINKYYYMLPITCCNILSSENIYQFMNIMKNKFKIIIEQCNMEIKIIHEKKN